MSEIVKELEKAGLKMVIKYDTDCASSPREWDNFGTIEAWDFRNFWVHETEGRTQKEVRFTTCDDFRAWAHEQTGIMVLPIVAYIHSGVTIKAVVQGQCLEYPFNDVWDSGIVGVIYATKEKILREFAGDRAKARQCLVNEIEAYNSYLVGEVYGFEIVDENDEVLDSCWGFVGDVSYCETEAL
jgi:hypothetical protein